MNIRQRINRWTTSRRDLIFSPNIKSSLVQPHFVVAGKNIDTPLESMPGINQPSRDVLIETVQNDYDNGIRAVMLFGVVEHS